MILADASVWINHLRRGDKNFSSVLSEEMVLTHPFIIGELALGQIRNRRQFLHDLSLLPQAALARDSEVMAWVEKNRMYGKGIGWVDAHLLVSSLLSHADLWTEDSALKRAARSLGVLTNG